MNARDENPMETGGRWAEERVESLEGTILADAEAEAARLIEFVRANRRVVAEFPERQTG